jgi:hypothetical protein
VEEVEVEIGEEDRRRAEVDMKITKKKTNDTTHMKRNRSG